MAKKDTQSARTDTPARKKRRNNKWTLTIIAVLFAIAVVAIVAVIVYQHFFVAINDNYDAQMRIAAREMQAGDTGKAETAYKRALGYQIGDHDATLALAEIYVKKEQYEDAAELYSDLLSKDDGDIALYDALIGLYAGQLDAPDKANELIVKAYQIGLTLTSELVQQPPEFSQKGGTFNQATKIELTAPEGYSVHYVTKKGTIPTIDDKLYKKAISLSKSGTRRIIAAVFDKDGLMGWPAENVYKIKIQVTVDNSAISNLGRGAGAIMKSVGPLYFSGRMEGGYYYKDNNSKFHYIFPVNSFRDKKTGDALNPEDTELPTSAKCVAISMTVSSYIVQPTGSVTVKDFMAGIDIKNYEVRIGDYDGAYHLIYDSGDERYDIPLPDKDKISKSKVMTVYSISAANAANAANKAVADNTDGDKNTSDVS
jgi:tetratricopeptide (TPR) repeat protein